MNTHRLESLAAELGDDGQRSKFAAGCLPEDELLALARTELFRPLAKMPRWAGRDWSKVEQDVAHEARCADSTLLYDHKITHLKTLTLHQWDSQAAIHRAAAEIRYHPWIQGDASVVVVDNTNTAICRRCHGTACRHVIRVSVEWAGRTLVREYVL